MDRAAREIAEVVSRRHQPLSFTGPDFQVQNQRCSSKLNSPRSVGRPSFFAGLLPVQRWWLRWDLRNRMDRRGTPKTRNRVAPGNRGNDGGHCLAVLCGRHLGTIPRLCRRCCGLVACSPTHRSTCSAAVRLFWPAGNRGGRSVHLSLCRLVYCLLLACAWDRPFGTPCRVKFEKTVILSQWRALRVKEMPITATNRRSSRWLREGPERVPRRRIQQQDEALRPTGRRTEAY